MQCYSCRMLHGWETGLWALDPAGVPMWPLVRVIHEIYERCSYKFIDLLVHSEMDPL